MLYEWINELKYVHKHCLTLREGLIFGAVHKHSYKQREEVCAAFPGLQNTLMRQGKQSASCLQRITGLAQRLDGVMQGLCRLNGSLPQASSAPQASLGPIPPSPCPKMPPPLPCSKLPSCHHLPTNPPMIWHKPNCASTGLGFSFAELAQDS